MEEIAKATRTAVTKETVLTLKSTEDSLQRIEKQVSEAVKLATKTHTQLDVILCNMASVMALIAAGISRGIKFNRENILHETPAEQGKWEYAAVLKNDGVETGDAWDVIQTGGLRQ